MMERLTGRNEKGDLLVNGKMVYSGEFYETASALEEYEDLEEDGKLLKLPCNPGDTVWVIQKRYTPCRYGQEFDESSCCGCECECDSEKKYIIVPVKSSLKWIISILNDFGKTVFLTEEEALEALEGMKKRK